MIELFFAVAFSAVPLTLYVPPIRSLNIFVETVEQLLRCCAVYTVTAYPRVRHAFSRLFNSAFRLLRTPDATPPTELPLPGRRIEHRKNKLRRQRRSPLLPEDKLCRSPLTLSRRRSHFLPASDSTTPRRLRCHSINLANNRDCSVNNLTTKPTIASSVSKPTEKYK